jgi:hypothetical protein
MSDKLLNMFSDPFAPPSNISGRNDEKVKSWCNREIKTSQNYLTKNKAWRTADICLSILLGDEQELDIIGMSTVSVNKSRRMLREGIANKSNFRPRWGYKTFSDNEEVINQTEVLDRLLESWWWQNFVDRYLRGAIQYADGSGTGYIGLCVELDRNTSEFEIIPYYKSHKDVLIGHPTEDLDLQKAKYVFIRHEMSLSEAMDKYKHAKDIIKQDRNSPSWIARTVNTIGDFVGLHPRDIINQGEKDRNTERIYPTVDIWECYIKDDSVNISGNSKIMGKADYVYEVPSYYDKDGNINTTSNGIGGLRNLTIDECKLYPTRRRIIYCSGGVIEDDCSPYWLDGPPIVQIKTDDVVGEFLGLPAIHDAYKLDRSVNSVLRAYEDSINGKLAPPLAVDTRIPRNIAKKFNMRMSIGQKFRYNVLQLAKAFVPLIPPEYYNVDNRLFDYVKILHELADYLTGTKDLTAMFQARQIPASDTQESLIQSLGPLAADQSRGIEYSLLKLGMIWKPLAFQTYTYKKRLTILGKKGTQFEDIDYDPDLLVPKKDVKDIRPRHIRAREHMNKFYFYAAPNSLHERESMTNQLKLFQMKKLNIPITDKKIYETMTGNNDFDQMKDEFYQQELEKALAAANIQSAMQNMAAMNDPMAMIVQMLQNNMSGNSIQRQLPFQKNPVGRPNDNEAPGRLLTKPDENGIPSGTLSTSDNS